MSFLRSWGGSVTRRIPSLGLPAGMLASSEFEAAFHREKARSDRFGREFTVVRIVTGDLPIRSFRRLAAVLSRSTRLSDSVGWLSPTEVGVLLADTGVSGAESWCKKLRGVLSEQEALVVDQNIFHHRQRRIDDVPASLPTQELAASPVLETMPRG